MSDVNMEEVQAVITPLGSNGWMPSEERQTASYLFQKENLTVILDFGTGICRLLNELDYLIDEVEHIIGFISHYHLDHTAGLFFLPGVLRGKSIDIYAPGKEVYGKAAREIMNQMFAPPVLTKELENFIPNLQIHDIPLDGAVIEGMEFKFRIQRKHALPTVAVRIGNHIAYCTDTEPEYETIEFVRGVNLLMHEVWHEFVTPAETILSEMVKEQLDFLGKDGHSSNIAVGLIAREAQVGEVLTIHHDPNQKDNVIHRMTSTASVISALDVEPADDGVSVEC